MDYVVNHVHQEHEYFAQHPEWFRTGCVCGTNNCDWTAQRLSCLFRDYLPDVDWTVTAAGEQLVDDAVWWVREFDLDGLRVDAVKHVEDIAITNLSTRIAHEFERGGTSHFLMGETAMGWSDCGSVECNAEQYEVISQYIGDHALDGQFDFVLYHSVPYNVFAYDSFGMIHADFWTKASETSYPGGSIMTPFIGSHDSTRFVSMATYRGQPGYDQGIVGNQWDNVAGPPPDAEPYERHRVALSWLLGLPGAPLLYYGDEYGEWGGADPGNRAFWRGDGPLSADEQAVLDWTRKLGAAPPRSRRASPRHVPYPRGLGDIPGLRTRGRGRHRHRGAVARPGAHDDDGDGSREPAAVRRDGVDRPPGRPERDRDRRQLRRDARRGRSSVILAP